MNIRLNPSRINTAVACCGMLEIAGRIKRGTTGRFSPRGDEFILDAELDLPAIVAGATVSGNGDEPLTLQGDGFSMQLNWWIRFPKLKCWAGQQRIKKIFTELQQAVRDLGSIAPAEWLSATYGGKFLTTSLFGMEIPVADYSQDDDGIRSMTRPIADVFAIIGLQRFWPALNGREITYRLWTEPLPLMAAPHAWRGAFVLGPAIGCRATTSNVNRQKRDISPVNTFSWEIEQ